MTICVTLQFKYSQELEWPKGKYTEPKSNRDAPLTREIIE
jgi:hypothetical protein